MWDMSDEHKIVCKDEEQAKLFDDTAIALEKVEAVLLKLPSFRNTCFAVDVYKLNKKSAEEVIKENIINYYEHNPYEPKHSEDEQRLLYENEIYGEEKEVKDVEGALKEAFRFYQLESQSTVTFTYDIINEYENAIKSAADWIRENYKTKKVRYCKIPKECKAFNNGLLTRTYIGIVFTGSYIVLDDYVIIVMFGTCD